MDEIKIALKDILKENIEENNWKNLSSSDYAEFFTVSEIGKEIILNGKKLSGQRVNEILEKMDFIKRNKKK